MSRAEWLKRLQEMQAELDEYGWRMWVMVGTGYLKAIVFTEDGTMDLWINDDEQENNKRRWSKFEEECKRLMPWWEVE